MGDWKDYINYLLANNSCDQAFILNKQNGEVWASTGTSDSLSKYPLEVENDEGKMVKVQVNETQTLLNAIKNRGSTSDIQGVRINNIKYNLSRFDDETDVYYYRGNGQGCCIALTKSCIIIGTFDQMEGQNPGDCNGQVENLQQEMINNDF